MVIQGDQNRRVLLGESAVVLVDVGAGATIRAGSVVVHEIPAGEVAIGNPARVIRGIDP